MNINIQVLLHNYVLWAIVAHKRVSIVTAHKSYNMWLLFHIKESVSMNVIAYEKTL